MHGLAANTMVGNCSCRSLREVGLKFEPFDTELLRRSGWVSRGCVVPLTAKLPEVSGGDFNLHTADGFLARHLLLDRVSRTQGHSDELLHDAVSDHDAVESALRRHHEVVLISWRVVPGKPGYGIDSANKYPNREGVVLCIEGKEGCLTLVQREKDAPFLGHL